MTRKLWQAIRTTQSSVVTWTGIYKQCMPCSWMKRYQGAKGWGHFINNMMLQDYVDADGKPKDIFDYVWSYMKDLDKDSYFRAVDKFCTFCEEVIPKRADQMIGVLKTIMNNK